MMKRTSETESEDTRISKLETVVNFIQECGNLGTIEEPDEYVEDVSRMQFVRLRGAAYFSGQQLGTTIGMGGSEHHLIGNAIGDGRGLSNSHANALLRLLEDETKDVKSDVSSMQAIVRFHKRLQGLEENFRFMAKRLAFEDVKYVGREGEEHERALLLSPLYVAKED
jgi:hypothetical protein